MTWFYIFVKFLFHGFWISQPHRHEVRHVGIPPQACCRAEQGITQVWPCCVAPMSKSNEDRGRDEKESRWNKERIRRDLAWPMPHPLPRPDLVLSGWWNRLTRTRDSHTTAHLSTHPPIHPPIRSDSRSPEDNISDPAFSTPARPRDSVLSARLLILIFDSIRRESSLFVLSSFRLVGLSSLFTHPIIIPSFHLHIIVRVWPSALWQKHHRCSCHSADKSSTQFLGPGNVEAFDFQIFHVSP